jgi:hypothetical protein
VRFGPILDDAGPSGAKSLVEESALMLIGVAREELTVFPGARGV